MGGSVVQALRHGGASRRHTSRGWGILGTTLANSARLGLTVCEAVGETVRQPCVYPTTASTRSVGSAFEIARPVPEIALKENDGS